MEDGFTPRIVVPDDTDAEIVFAALIGYIGSLAGRVAMGCAVDMHTIGAMRRAVDLVEVVGEDLTAASVRKLAGEIPDDVSALDRENGD